MAAKEIAAESEIDRIDDEPMTFAQTEDED